MLVAQNAFDPIPKLIGRFIGKGIDCAVFIEACRADQSSVAG